MAAFIPLTKTDGTTIHVNPARIDCFESDFSHDETKLHFAGGTRAIMVQGSPEEIRRLLSTSHGAESESPPVRKRQRPGG